MPEYLIVEDDSTAELSAMITLMMRKGWEPIGGVAVAISTTRDPRHGVIETVRTFYQALTRNFTKESDNGNATG